MAIAQEQSRRRHPRTSVAWPVVVEAGTSRYACQAVDISAHGAKVRTKVRLKTGTAVRLRWHNDPPMVTVMSQREDKQYTWRVLPLDSPVDWALRFLPLLRAAATAAAEALCDPHQRQAGSHRKWASSHRNK